MVAKAHVWVGRIDAIRTLGRPSATTNVATTPSSARSADSSIPATCTVRSKSEETTIPGPGNLSPAVQISSLMKIPGPEVDEP